jgi:hypothetical protein
MVGGRRCSIEIPARQSLQYRAGASQQAAALTSNYYCRNWIRGQPIQALPLCLKLGSALTKRQAEWLVPEIREDILVCELATVLTIDVNRNRYPDDRQPGE